MIGVYLLFSVFIVIVLSHDICEGEWKNWSNDIPLQVWGDGGLGWHEYRDTSLLCPADTFYANLFFHKVFDRANNALKRSWISSDSSCLDYSPLKYFHLMHSRKLILLGDSTTMQIFQSFVCSLYSITKSEMKLQWNHHHDGKVYTDVTCPLKEKHCHLWASSILFPDAQSSIEFRDIYDYPPNSLRSWLHDTGPRDVVVINFGLHFNDKSSFESALQSFSKDLSDYFAMKGNEAPKILFRESLPTHFETKTSSAGYFHDKDGQPKGARCVPLPAAASYEQIVADDWRNNLLEKYLNSTGVGLMKVAKALYSQYDAHIDGDSKIVSFEAADCVHYAAQSGVFHYLKRIHLNYIAHALSPHLLHMNASARA